MDKKEMGWSTAGPPPTVKGLTADERAFLHAGGRIVCDASSGRWVKRRVGPGAFKQAPRRPRQALELIRLKVKLFELET